MKEYDSFSIIAASHVPTYCELHEVPEELRSMVELMFSISSRNLRLIKISDRQCTELPPVRGAYINSFVSAVNRQSEAILRLTKGEIQFQNDTQYLMQNGTITADAVIIVRLHPGS